MKLSILTPVVILLACKNHTVSHDAVTPAKTGLTGKKPSYHLINSFGLVWKDTSIFYPLACGLYMNKAGVIGYKAIDKSMLPDIAGDVYLVSVYYADRNDTLNGGLMDMNKVVDTATFKMTGDLYWKDKRHIYNFHPMMDGGTISINRDADLSSFQVLGIGIYAKDRKHCFYRGHVIMGADLRSFNVYKNRLYNSAYDINHYYAGSDVISAQEAHDSGLDTAKKAQ